MADFGVDSCDPVDQTFLNSVVDEYGWPIFWGRYLSNIPACPNGAPTANEVSFLHGGNQQGRYIYILLIQNNIAENEPSYSQGISAAFNTQGALSLLGVPSGKVAFADIEDWAMTSDWIRGWCDGMAQSQWGYGLYCTPSAVQSNFCQAMLIDNNVANCVIYSNEPQTGSCAAGADWNPDNICCPSVCMETKVWQYHISCPDNVDLNETIDLSLMW